MLAGKIDTDPSPCLSCEYECRSIYVNFQFKALVVKDARDPIAKIKTIRGFGNEDISCYFSELVLPFTEKSLAGLFNTSIETSLLPDSWKLARVTPIFKEGEKTEKSNYRPVSVLPVVARLFEKLVPDQLHQYMTDNDYFSSDQSGFCNFIPL